MWRNIVLVFVLGCVVIIKCQFFDCHDDPGYSPDEGPLADLQFTWLGALQYIHGVLSMFHDDAVKNGTPHYFRVPRVILISRQFVLSTAIDAAQIPEGYAFPLLDIGLSQIAPQYPVLRLSHPIRPSRLPQVVIVRHKYVQIFRGNVIFGDYERDEVECRVSIEDIAAGIDCEPAVLLMPIADVLLHPEYKHFGAKYSVALLKLITPVKSKYMLPACLPFKNYLIDKNGKLIRTKLFHIDFTSDVPRDFIEEEKEVTRISILPRELCYLYDGAENSTKMTRNRMACTTGCGFHSGAPTLVHEHTGHWSIVALSQGGPPCPDPLRARRPPPPPHHIMIHPYVPWITAAITGKAVGAFAKDDPFGFIMPRASIYDLIAHGWVGHWWMGGLRCYDRGEAADDIFKFYHEVFQLKPITQTYLTYYLEIDAAHDTMIICVKVGMPYQLGQPRVWELDSPIVKVRIPLIKFNNLYKFQVEAWGYNSTESETSTESSSTIETIESKSAEESA